MIDKKSAGNRRDFLQTPKPNSASGTLERVYVQRAIGVYRVCRAWLAYAYDYGSLYGSVWAVGHASVRHVSTTLTPRSLRVSGMERDTIVTPGCAPLRSVRARHTHKSTRLGTVRHACVDCRPDARSKDTLARRTSSVTHVGPSTWATTHHTNISPDNALTIISARRGSRRSEDAQVLLTAGQGAPFAAP